MVRAKKNRAFFSVCSVNFFIAFGNDDVVNYKKKNFDFKNYLKKCSKNLKIAKKRPILATW
tara:strand:- start:103 stop:285 length:183 start_codon:yes stop_codon:yes gene_type:complete